MYRVGGVPEGTNPNSVGHGLLEDLKTFRVQLQARQVCPPRDVAARPRKTSDEPAPDRIGDESNNDRYRRGGSLGRQGRWGGRGEHEVYPESDEVSRQL